MTHKQKIYNLLKDGNWHNFRELNDICFRYGGRLHDLKKEGINHEIKKVEGVLYYKIDVPAPRAMSMFDIREPMR